MKKKGTCTYIIKDIPEDLWKQVKAKCAASGITVKKMIMDYLLRWTGDTGKKEKGGK